MAAFFIPPKIWGPTCVWLGLSDAYAGLTRRLRSAYAGGAGSFWQTTSKSRRHPNRWCLTCHVLLSIPLYFYNNYDKIRLRKLLTQWYIIHGYAKVLTRLTQPWEFSGIALTRSFSSSPFFIFLSFQKKTLLIWVLLECFDARKASRHSPYIALVSDIVGDFNKFSTTWNSWPLSPSQDSFRNLQTSRNLWSLQLVHYNNMNPCCLSNSTHQVSRKTSWSH